MNDVPPSPAETARPAADPAVHELLGTTPTSFWRRYRRWIITGAVLLVLALLLARCFRSGEPTAYATEEVTRGDLTVTVSATGNLAPTNQVEVGSEESGLVTDVYVDNNSRVSKGQPLARLDTSRLRDSLVQNQAALAAAQAQVAQQQATEAQARANLARLEQVYKVSGGQVPSKTELDTGRADYQRGVASVRAAQAQVAQARANLATSQTNLAKATIYSPVTGVVLSRQIDPGQTVAASFQAPVLFTIAEDLSRMKLQVKVDEADVGQVFPGQRATFTVDAYPGQVFPAMIQRVDVGANATNMTTSTGTTSSTNNNVIAYTAELSVDNPQLTLRPGMTATAEIVTMQKKNVLLVPNAALRFAPSAGGANARSGMGGMMMPPRFRRPGEQQATIGRGSHQTLYVLGSDRKPQPVQVTIGDTNGSFTEIVGGLRPGQKVITSELASGASSSGSRRAGSGAARGQGSGQRRGSGGPNG